MKLSMLLWGTDVERSLSSLNSSLGLTGASGKQQESVWRAWDSEDSPQLHDSLHQTCLLESTKKRGPCFGQSL